MSITSYFEDFNIEDFNILENKNFRNTNTPFICMITAKIKNIEKKITTNKLINKKLSMIS